MRPDIDGRLAERLRDVLQLQADSQFITAEEKARILNIAADVLEEYVMDANKRAGRS